MRKAFILLFIFTLNNKTFGQELQSRVFQENILSLQCHPQDFELGYPILHKETATALILSFDILGEEQPALAYKIIHCDAKWHKSNIQIREFLTDSFNEFYIDDYELSIGTKQLYTHYKTTISQKQLKLSGNYILQVFPQDNPDEIWLQQRFLYVEPLTSIQGTVERENAMYHKTKQRIAFKVDYNNRAFTFPKSSFTAVVLQNFRWETARYLKPLFINQKELSFNYIDKRGRFDGNYEFPYFDTSIITQKTATIRSVEKDEDGTTHCYLYPHTKAPNNYFYLKDMNGNVSIVAENIYNTATEAEYVWVHFTFGSEKLPDPIFVVGRFNQWTTSPNYELRYDESLQAYHIGLLLKQGVYNYTLVSNNNGNLTNLLGNYSETENDYYIFLYYKEPRLQTDRLVGWKRLSSKER